MNNRITDTISQIKKYSTRILLLVVILTSCYSSKFAAYGKYLDYVYDYSSAVAGSFCFSSGDLTDESDFSQHTISTFDGSELNLTFEIRNYENSYIFNNEDQPIYYYVQAEVFEDSQYTEPSKHPFTTTIKYGTNDAYVAARIEGLLRDNGNNTEIQGPNIYNNVAILKGMSGNEFHKESGRCAINVTIKWDPMINDEEAVQYVRISAKTLPTYEASKLKPLKESGTFGNPEQYTEVLNIDTGKVDLIPNYSYGAPDNDEYAAQIGVFEKVLVGRYELITSGAQGSSELTGMITRQSQNNYAITFSINNPTDNILSSRIYYDPSRLVPDQALGEGTAIELDGRSLRYVNSGKILEKGSENYSFYKYKLGDTIVSDSKHPETSDIFLIVESDTL